MKKADFINNTESWLISNDIKDSCYRYSPSQISKMNINNYTKEVSFMLKNKAPELVPVFKKMMKENRVRGMK